MGCWNSVTFGFKTALTCTINSGLVLKLICVIDYWTSCFGLMRFTGCNPQSFRRETWIFPIFIHYLWRNCLFLDLKFLIGSHASDPQKPAAVIFFTQVFDWFLFVCCLGWLYRVSGRVGFCFSTLVLLQFSYHVFWKDKKLALFSFMLIMIF